MKVRVFTDGACEGNGKDGARASYACWFPENKELSVAALVPEDQQQTNNRGELLAISEAVKISSVNFNASEVDLEIYSDSKYSISCLTVWLPGWIAKGWKTSTNTNVSHRDLIEATANMLTTFKSHKFTHVRAHTGEEDDLSVNNNIVDKMAVAVLSPQAEEKVVRTNTETPIEGLPISLMGPPVTERTLSDWCKKNLDKLDKNALSVALIQALTKTVRKNGFEIVKQKLHSSSQYRLITKNHLILNNTTITKEE
jgi:ribonuclease HI